MDIEKKPIPALSVKAVEHSPHPPPKKNADPSVALRIRMSILYNSCY